MEHNDKPEKSVVNEETSAAAESPVTKLSDDELGMASGGKGRKLISTYMVCCKFSEKACRSEWIFDSARKASDFIKQHNKKCPYCHSGELSMRTEARYVLT